jgi:hypothetical protein
MGFGKNEYEHKTSASTEYLEGSKAKLLGNTDKSMHEMMANEGSAEDLSLAADVGGEHLLSSSIGASDDAANADV